MSRPRVLHCIYDDPSNPWLGGGGAHRVREIYRRLSGELEVTVSAGAFPGSRDREEDGVAYRYLGLRRPYAASRLTYGRAATRLLRAGEYEAAVFDFSVYTPIRIPPREPVGHVVHMLIGPTARGRWGGLGGRLVDWRERRMLRGARRVQTTSEWMRRQLLGRVPSDARVEVVASGVDDAFFRVRRAEPSHLLFYGRFDVYQKGLDVLFAGYARLRATDRSAPPLVVAGRGDAGRVAALAREAGIAGDVRIEAGVERAAVLDLMAGAMALLMPSRFEGLPMVAAEAMAAGVPVVATRVGAMEEIIDPGRTGLLVEPERPEPLAEAALRLVREGAVREGLGEAARRSAERFRWDAVARAHLRWLLSVRSDVVR